MDEPTTRSRIAAFTILSLVASIGVLIIDTPAAHAVSITVNTASDPSPDASTGHYPTDGLCSLRAAIHAAQVNSNAADVDCATGTFVPNVLDVIQIDPSLAGQTLTLSHSVGGVVQPFDKISGPANPLEIIGPTTDAADFVIDANHATRPFDVGYVSIEAGVLTLANLTVSNGNGAGGDGGALIAWSASSLTFDNVVFRGNSGGRGGAIFAQEPTITNNGGAYIDNHATSGGAIYLEEGNGNQPATFNGYAMLLQGNTATANGGAIGSNPGASNPFIHIERSLIRDNSAPNGGVVYVNPSIVTPATTFELTDSTVTGNSSVFMSTATTQRYSYLRNTFVDTGALFDGTGGGLVANSIITGTTSCHFVTNVANYQGVRNRVAAFASPGDCGVSGMNPLGPVTGLSATLAQNGGPEVQQTYALTGGSNAIDQGSAAYCGTTDARSVARGLDGDGTVDSPQVGDCDIGAYEFAKFVVNFVTGTSSVNEDAGTVDVQVKLRILDPTSAPLQQAIAVPIAVDTASTATQTIDFTLLSGFATFPVGAVDGAIANVSIGIHQDDVAELFGEIAHLDLGAVPGGIIVAEPKRHNLSIQDDDQAGVVIDDGGDGTQIAEATPGIGDSVTFRLESQPDRALIDPSSPGDPSSFGPPADVDVTATPDRDCTVSDGVHTGTQSTPLTFTIANADWQTGHTVTFFAVDDLWDEDLRDESAPHRCELRFTFDSLDPVYDATQDAYDVSVTDNDVAGVNIDPISETDPLVEGSNDASTYAISLDTPPDPGKPLPVPARGPTKVILTPAAGCTLGAGDATPVSFDFTGADFSTPQVAEVRPTDNMVVELLHDCTVTSSISSLDPVYDNLDDLPAFAGTPGTVHAIVQDYDPPGITNDPPFVIVDTGTGVAVDEATPLALDTISVVLHRAPLNANVSVDLSVDPDPQIGGPQLAMAKPTALPAASASLVFTPQNWNVPQLVEVHAVDDDYDEDDVHPWSIDVEMASTAVGFDDSVLRRIVVDGQEQIGTATVPVAITDDDTSAIVVGPDPTAIEGGASGTLTVQLATHPYDDVMLTISTDSQCTVEGQSSVDVSVAAGHWNVPAALTVAAIDDPDAESSPHPCAIEVLAASADALYDPLSASAAAAITDDDVAEVVVTASAPLQVSEAGPTSDTFDAVLASRPSADVSVTVTHDGQTASVASFTFTHENWDVPQSVDITAVDDAVDEASVHGGTVTLDVVSTAVGYASGAGIKVDGIATPSIAVLVTDDDTASVTTTPSSLTVMEAGAAETYSITLGAEPSTAVSVALAATGLCAVDPPTITIDPTQWSSTNAVTVTPGNDDIVHASTCSVQHTVTSADPQFDGLLVADVTVTVVEDDAVGVHPSVSQLNLIEAGVDATYSIVLGSEPVATVTVGLAASGLCAVSPASLTFSPGDWSVPQLVTVTPGDDNIVQAETCTVQHTVTSQDVLYDGLGAADVTGSVVDDDAPPPPPPPITNPPASSPPLHDACPDVTGGAMSFGDVDPSSVHADAIECLLRWGITVGVGDGRYDPTGVVSRAQIATLLLRLLDAVGIDLPTGPDAFGDDDGSLHEDAINRLAAGGIVHGVGPGTYAPQEGLSRGQLASLLARVWEAITSEPLRWDGDHFGDDDGSVHEDAINRLAAAHIVQGLADGTFGAELLVRRDQMASLLARTLELLVIHGSATPPA